MRLLIDIGNTRSKFALEDNSGVQPAFVLEHGDLNSEALQSRCSDTLTPASVWISSVGEPSVLSIICNWVESQFSIQPNLVAVSEECCGLRNAYHDQLRLGVDRWVAAVGAEAMASGKDIIIIDAGTAVTVDWLSRKGVFEGGAILPGYELMQKSLVGNTAGVEADLALTRRIVGKTTTECVNSGLSYGLAGAVDRIVQEMQKHLDTDNVVVLTGGGAEKLATHLFVEHIVEPHLVLLGLARIAGGAE
ncbi:MAG: type III pantothenate kinase [Arenicella sp.]|nr:type III pantothenate kinase [Arenicella sp.]